MLEQIGVSRNWLTAPLEPPLGRGINLEVWVEDIASAVAQLIPAEYSLFVAPETKEYRVDDVEVAVRQFLVTDPDGYLIRFQWPTTR